MALHCLLVHTRVITQNCMNNKNVLLDLWDIKVLVEVGIEAVTLRDIDF